MRPSLFFFKNDIIYVVILENTIELREIVENVEKIQQNIGKHRESSVNCAARIFSNSVTNRIIYRFSNSSEG